MSKRASKRINREKQKHYALETKLNLDIKHVTPLTVNQEITFRNFIKKHMFLHGSAGTGKSFIASYLALREIFSQSTPYKKLVIVRSTVQGRDMGHIPGKPSEKHAPFEQPYHRICGELIGRGDAYTVLKQKGLIEFISTSFIRGITLDDCIVLVDECQNMNHMEMHSIMTRVGKNCKIIFAGDIRQTDLNKRKELSGISDFIKIIKYMNSFFFVEFTEDDIVRSDVCKEYIIAKNRLEETGTIEMQLV